MELKSYIVESLGELLQCEIIQDGDNFSIVIHGIDNENGNVSKFIRDYLEHYMKGDI